ncbi:MAG: four helix bundle protein [Actinomycetota bacterium]
MHDFRELKVWRRGMSLARRTYSMTETFPASQRFGLTSQIQRSAISIPSNIAEGSGRSSNKDFARFLSIAYGSACELETHLILACDFGYLSAQDLDELSSDVVEIRRMLFALHRTVSA